MLHYFNHLVSVIESKQLDRLCSEIISYCYCFCSICLASPREPQNVTVEEIDQASVKISWKKPIDNAHDLVYRIECHRLIEGRSVPCESYVIYQPNRTFINGTR